MGIRFTHPANHILWFPFAVSPGDCALVSQADAHLAEFCNSEERILFRRIAKMPGARERLGGIGSFSDGLG